MSLDPNSGLGNEQTVTVSWSGFQPTKADENSFSVPYDNLVGVYECAANPPGGIYYYTQNCYTQTPPNDSAAPSDGNMVDPMLNVTGLWGVTGSDGQGQIGFQVQEGTLHTNQRFTWAGQPVPAFNLQCDQTDPCVIKVVDFGTYFDDFNNVPNFPGSPLTKGDWSELVDAAPSVQIPFAPLPHCPPPSSGTPQLHVEGAGSSSYALDAWDARLCMSSTPLAVDYTTTGEVSARTDFEGGATDVALAALSPSSGPGGGSYAAAPIDVSGAAIGFRMSDQVTGTPITTVRITPRLVAMLVTNSATFGDIYADSAQIYPLTEDPEFQALNPGFHFPGAFGQLGVIEPLLEGSASDDTEILTQWIADDADARAFLAGHDPCGTKLNASWAGVEYPTSIFRDLEANPSDPAWSGYYNPLTNLVQEVTDLFFGKPAGFNPVDNTGTAASMLPVVPTEDAMFAELDSTSAARAAVPAARLSAASAASTIGNYVNGAGTGSCTPKALTSFPGFTAPSPASLDLAVAHMGANRDGTLNPPVATSVEGAYPLTKVDYAFVPTSRLSPSEAGALAEFIRYTAGAGQRAGVLPYGYTPLPPSLAAQDASAVSAVLRGIAPSGPTSASSTDGEGLISSTAGGPRAIVGSTSGDRAAEGRRAGLGTPSAVTAAASGAGESGRTPGPQRSGGLAGEAAVAIGALERAGYWLLPVVAALAVGLGLVGMAVGWELTPPRRRPRRP